MPSLIEGATRETVMRAVSKPSNKIHAAAIARLYVAYPDRQRWTYTGLQGAIVLANDNVGNTLWLKLVDVSPTNRGVIWDQEIYDTFQYNQDRIFFHTFEMEQCLAGLSFVDDKEAKQFKKKMDEREKNAPKNTRTRPFGTSAGQPDGSSTGGKSHGLLGGFGRNVFGHRHASGSQPPPAQYMMPPQQSTMPPQQFMMPPQQLNYPQAPPAAPSPRSSGSVLDNIDPQLLGELKSLGLTEDQLADNADFIKSYVSQRQANADVEDHRSRAPPPPPPQPLTPQDTGNTSSSSGRRGAPPAPPPARRAAQARPPSPPQDQEPQAPSPPPPAHSTFRVPAFLGAGKLAGAPDPEEAPTRKRAESSAASTSGPPPPPRPPKTPLQDEEMPKFGVPPPFSGERKPVPPPSRGPVPPPPPARNSGGPPPPPPRDIGPPPPPARDTYAIHAIPPAAALPPPPLPPKTPNAPAQAPAERPMPPPPAERPIPPPPRSRDARSVPPPPPMPSAPRPSAAVPPPPPPPPMPSSSGPPPPPPMPSSSGPPPPPPMSSSSGPPPPPPMPSMGGPPPPPPMPSGGSKLAPGMEPVTANAPPAAVAGDRGGLLADIRGGASLKRVSAQEKRDRSAATVAGGSSSGAGAGGASPTVSAGDQGGLAGALASALAQRKTKVSHSDDEDGDDDW